MGEGQDFTLVEGGGELKPISVLLLDDREENLLIRSTILRQKGYHIVCATTIPEAESKLAEIDIAVLDYHLGEGGGFGTDVARTLRAKRPEVPIIILSATLERKFGGIADMHLLKGYSSVDDLVQALRSFEGKRRGKPVVVDSRDFYYSRIVMAMGDDMVVEIFDRDGNWQYVNEHFAALGNEKRSWYIGRNLFDHFPEMREEWGEILRTVADTRETYIDRRNHGALPHLPPVLAHRQWNVLVFPIKLHDGRDGVILNAHVGERK
jgi:CheY-like chemotaxis protein